MKKNGRNVTRVDLNNPAIKQILALLLEEFRKKGLGSQNLRSGYKGLSPADLKSQCCNAGQVGDVDFDLAIKELIDAGLVKTGPMEMYDNDPNSGVLILMMFSKNEYSHLTETGYKQATQVRSVPSPRQNISNVHISGSTFNHSPVGIGAQVSQQVSISASSEDMFERFRAAITEQITDQNKQTTALDYLAKIEVATEKPAKLDLYNHFVGTIADHITVFGPLLPILLHYVMM